jgi:hypothetical protein
MTYDRFDGREIRVDKASDTGPKNSYGRGNGAYAGQVGHVQQPQMYMAYGMPNAAAMYPQASYGRGGYPSQPIAYGTQPAQGKSRVIPLQTLYNY